MSNIRPASDLVLVDTKLHSGTVVLPLTSQIPGRTITIKDSTGYCGKSTLTISTSGTDQFETGTNLYPLFTSYGSVKLVANEGQWTIAQTAQPTYLTISTLKTINYTTQTLTTSNITVSSFMTGSSQGLHTSTNLLYWGSYLLGGGARAAEPQFFFPLTNVKGSLYFAGTTVSYLSIPNFAGLQFGTGDFTIEFWVYQQTGISFPRFFSMGTYPSATIAISIEGGNFYFWAGGGANNFGSVNLTTGWNHVAISRQTLSTRVFINGTILGSALTITTNFNDTTNSLTIGSESAKAANSMYKGYMTNFRWIKGTALYTANFPRPTAPLTAVSGTQILLLASSSTSATVDSSSLANTVTNNGNNVTWFSLSPF